MKKEKFLQATLHSRKLQGKAPHAATQQEKERDLPTGHMWCRISIHWGGQIVTAADFLSVAWVTDGVAHAVAHSGAPCDTL